MKILKIIILIILSLGIISDFKSQIKNVKTVTVVVYGNCNICKGVIEKAGWRKHISLVNWDKNSQTAVLKFDSSKTGVNEILKKIALAGYDNAEYLAPTEAYNSLPPCCQYERQRIKAAVKKEDFSDTTRLVKSKPVNPVDVILDRYIELKEALIAGDSKTASLSAQLLHNEVLAVQTNTLSNGLQAKFSQHAEDIQKLAKEIANTLSLDLQRSKFGNLSSGIYELAKEGSSKTFFYQHCPMFNNGKNSNWISYDKIIRNPFYGSQMISCGKTVESVLR